MGSPNRVRGIKNAECFQALAFDIEIRVLGEGFILRVITDGDGFARKVGYDVIFNPSSYGEHARAFCGFGKQPSLKTIQQIAHHANYTWS